MDTRERSELDEVFDLTELTFQCGETGNNKRVKNKFYNFRCECYEENIAG